MKIAVFGSAFNPPTNSHLNIIKELSANFDKVLVVPCYSHNFGKKMIDFDDRLNMASLLINGLSPNIEISDIERRLFNDTISTTYSLLCALRVIYPTDELIFACGKDNADIENWKRFSNYKLIDKEFGKYIVSDQGLVRSTLVRESFKNNQSIDAYTKIEIVNYLKNNNISF